MAVAKPAIAKNRHRITMSRRRAGRSHRQPPTPPQHSQISAPATTDVRCRHTGGDGRAAGLRSTAAGRPRSEHEIFHSGDQSMTCATTMIPNDHPQETGSSPVPAPWPGTATIPASSRRRTINPNPTSQPSLEPALSPVRLPLMAVALLVVLLDNRHARPRIFSGHRGLLLTTPAAVRSGCPASITRKASVPPAASLGYGVVGVSKRMKASWPLAECAGRLWSDPDRVLTHSMTWALRSRYPERALLQPDDGRRERSTHRAKPIPDGRERLTFGRMATSTLPRRERPHGVVGSSGRAAEMRRRPTHDAGDRDELFVAIPSCR